MHRIGFGASCSRRWGPLLERDLDDLSGLGHKGPVVRVGGLLSCDPGSRFRRGRRRGLDGRGHEDARGARQLHARSLLDLLGSQGGAVRHLRLDELRVRSFTSFGSGLRRRGAAGGQGEKGEEDGETEHVSLQAW